jgi:dethiobiotin synthetase
VLRHAALKHIRAIRRNFDVVLIEGAGGLLSPLGVDFNARDLMRALAATPVIVAANRLGVVNQLLLTLEALPRNLQSRARVVLMAPPKPTLAAAFNAGMLKRLARQPVHIIPWLGRKIGPETIHGMPQLQRSLGAISAGVQATD